MNNTDLLKMLFHSEMSNVELAKNIILNSWDEIGGDIKKFFPTKGCIKKIKQPHIGVFKNLNGEIDDRYFFELFTAADKKTDISSRTGYNTSYVSNFSLKYPLSCSFSSIETFRYKIDVPKKPNSICQHLKKMLGGCKIENTLRFVFSLNRNITDKNDNLTKIVPIDIVSSLYCQYITAIANLLNTDAVMFGRDVRINIGLEIFIPIGYSATDFKQNRNWLDNMLTHINNITNQFKEKLAIDLVFRNGGLCYEYFYPTKARKTPVTKFLKYGGNIDKWIISTY